jgi:hypothetical protein
VGVGEPVDLALKKEKNMSHKVYFWMLLVIFLSLGFLIQVQKANAMVAAKIEPNVIELSTTNIYGFEVKHVSHRKIKDVEWTYFCISEAKPRRSLASKSKLKCFYGLKQDFGEVKVGDILNGIQYGLKDKIQNKRGVTPLRKNAYIYPARILRPQYISLAN